MEKIYFMSDYLEGCHPKILEALVKTNFEQTPGYSEDYHSQNAKALIKDCLSLPDSDVHILVGGTQTNLTVIAATLRPHQGVICADSGHINVHETGAIEACGHKVLGLKSQNGKITAKQIEEYFEKHHSDPSFEHIVQPGMVYISFPTESGTIYSKQELCEIYEVCKKCELPLFIDGARLGYGLASLENDLTIKEIARLCDVFYIGGTKCGALFGEAVVINLERLKKDFRYIIKQKGGMLAKGRLLGIQFETLFTDGLYFDICKGAVEKAMLIRDAFVERGIKMGGTSSTNQQFPILTLSQVEYLNEFYAYEIWEKLDDGNILVRFCTSWATTDQAVSRLISHIKTMPL